MIKTAIFAAAAALATVATAAPVFARDIAVSYRDLDLSTPEGQGKLARRLETAARDACSYGDTPTGSRLPSQESTQCYKDAQVRSKDTLASIVDNVRKGG